jgi:hypothetical protein
VKQTLTPDGYYLGGLWQAPDFARQLGIITSEWSRVEEEMISIFNCLLGSHKGAPAKQIYHSIISATVRIKMMRAALEESAVNKDRNESWDWTIDRFAQLNVQRNRYVHGLWSVYIGKKPNNYTPNPKTMRVYLRPTSIEDDAWAFGDAREVKLEEMADLAEGMGAFIGYARRFSVEAPQHEKIRKREQALQKKRAQQD